MRRWPKTSPSTSPRSRPWHDRVGDYKFPLGMLDSFRRPKTDDERKIHDWIEAWRGHEAQRLQEETFKQARRLADANRALESKETKTALNEQRIATNKVEQLKRKLADLARTKHEARDDRIFPGIYSSVLAPEQGRRFVAPMRYGCRPAGKPASYDEEGMDAADPAGKPNRSVMSPATGAGRCGIAR